MASRRALRALGQTCEDRAGGPALDNSSGVCTCAGSLRPIGNECGACANARLKQSRESETIRVARYAPLRSALVATLGPPARSSQAPCPYARWRPARTRLGSRRRVLHCQRGRCPRRPRRCAVSARIKGRRLGGCSRRRSMATRASRSDADRAMRIVSDSRDCLSLEFGGAPHRLPTSHGIPARLQTPDELSSVRRREQSPRAVGRRSRRPTPQRAGTAHRLGRRGRTSKAGNGATAPFPQCPGSPPPRG